MKNKKLKILDNHHNCNKTIYVFDDILTKVTVLPHLHVS